MNAPLHVDVAGELPRRTVILTMAGVIAALLLGALDGTIVGTAMPRVIADLHGFEHYAAVTTVYMLTATVVVPIAGKLSDLYGRKPFLLAGVAIFTLASAWCGGASSMMELVVARGVQGVGAGLCQAMAMTTIADLFPPARRGRVSGVMGGVYGLASVIGPALGGFLTDGPGWRWCFWVNLPVGLAAFAVLLVSFPNKRHATERPAIDWLGAFTLVAATVPILLALSWGGREHAWGSPLIVAMLVGGVAMAVAFFFVERRAPAAIIPPSLFRDPIVAAGAAAASLVAAGMFGALMFIPLFLQGVVGVSATKSGSVMTPMMFAMIATSVAAGQIMTRVGRYKAVAVCGVVVVTVALAWLATMSVDTTYEGVLVRMILLGLGLGATMPVFNLAVQNAVDIRQVGVATSSVQFLRQLGGSVGVAVFGAIMTNRFVHAFHDAVPADVAARVPADALAPFENPQMLMNPDAQAAVRDGALSQVLAPLLEAVRIALASSLQTVFVASTVVVGVGVVVTLLLRDAPLRKTNRRDDTPQEPAAVG